MSRMMRSDALPERANYQDNGCRYIRTPCTECPLPECYMVDEKYRKDAVRWRDEHPVGTIPAASGGIDDQSKQGRTERYVGQGRRGP